MKIIGIIPARYASTRFPAKALVDIEGKTMIRRVYEQALKCASLSEVIVATDHPRIYEEIKSFGGKVVMTPTAVRSGTDRCLIAYETLRLKADYVINIQGDEPFIQPRQITLLADLLDGKAELATLAKKIENQENLFDANVVKVVIAANGTGLYFSRQAIPHIRGEAKEDWLKKQDFYKHIGIYAYRTDILAKFTEMKSASLEEAESLEQLRWLENGYQMKVGITTYDSIGIDTAEDLENALKSRNR